VVTDPDPDSRLVSPFRCYMECLARIPDDATHHLIVQDDALPCSNFRTRAEARISEHPDVLMPLFVAKAGENGRVYHKAADRGEKGVWLPPTTWCPTVALCWPVEQARAYREFAVAKWGPRQQGDDSPVGIWRARTKARAWAPIPSLVEHPDVEPSLFRKGKAHAGRNKARVAVRFED
jgi:hypothetical protein